MSSHPATEHLAIYQGDTYLRGFQVLDANDTPIDITGWTIAAQIRRTTSRAGTLLASFTVTKTAAANGEFTLGLTSAETAELDPGKWRWDLQRTVSGDVLTLLAGEAEVTAEVTTP